MNKLVGEQGSQLIFIPNIQHCKMVFLIVIPGPCDFPFWRVKKGHPGHPMPPFDIFPSWIPRAAKDGIVKPPVIVFASGFDSR